MRLDAYDRPPCQKWGEGRITLLGDAAHPMTPNLGQGACQAIESAHALAQELAAHRDEVVAGLRAYEDRRRERSAWFVRQSWRIGKISQWQHPLARWLRDQLTRLTPRSVVERQTESIYAADFGGA